MTEPTPLSEGRRRRTSAARTTAPSSDPGDVTAGIDRLNLAQALVDVEIANDRARDLTQRLATLVERNAELMADAHELASARSRIAELEALHASRPYRFARILAAVVARLRK